MFLHILSKERLLLKLSILFFFFLKKVGPMRIENNFKGHFKIQKPSKKLTKLSVF